MKKNTLLNNIIITLLLFIFYAQHLSANILEDFSKIVNEKQQFIKSSRNIISGVKSLYRERKSIAEFAYSANVLLQAYKGLQGQSNIDSIPKLIEIANAINTLVKEYNNLAPKASNIYSQIKPDLNYISTFQPVYERLDKGHDKFLIKTLPNSRINSIATANGLSRVWDAIKNNPMNLFRWGRLRDEFTYGKLEAQYALKAAQIAFETETYINYINTLMNDLINIRNEINQIVNGNIIYLLGVNNTINKIISSASTVEKIAVLSDFTLKNLQKKFGEFVKIQEEYVTFHQNYIKKYYPQVANTKQDNYISNANNNVSIQNNNSVSTGIYEYTSNTPPTQSTKSVQSVGNLQEAMIIYQKAYEEYIKVMHNPASTEAERRQAITNLQNSKRQVEKLKSK